MATSIAELFVTIGAEVGDAVKGLADVDDHIKSMAAAAAPAGIAMVALGGALTAMAAEGVKAFADFDAKMTAVRNNTTMTSADAETMRQTVLSLGSTAPVELDKLADGFMHVSNFGYSAADAATILDAAMKSAVSTGGDTARTAEILAAAMHEFNIPAAEAAQTMDMLHTAAAEGNMTLEQFSDSFGQVAAWAAAIGVPLDQVAAAMSAMTRHGFNAAEAATQVKDQIEHLINPSAEAKKALEALGKAAGEDLSKAMTPTELHAKGLTGVLDELHAAMDKTGMSADEQTAMWMKLVPNIRGGAASFVLAGRGAEDFSTILSDLHTQMGITDEAFARSQATAAAQWGILDNQLKIVAITLGQALVPAVTVLAGFVSNLVKGFMALPEAVQSGIAVFGAITGVVLTLAGGLVLLLPGILALPTAFAALGTVAAAAAAALGAVLWPVLAIGAAVALLAVAWQNDWGGIREVTASAIDAIAGYFNTSLKPALDEFVAYWNSTLAPALQQFGGFLQQYVFPFLGALVNLYFAVMRKEIQLIASLWTNVLLPAFQTTGQIIGDFVIKPLMQLFDLFKKVVDMLASNPITANMPGVQALLELSKGFPTITAAITGAVAAAPGAVSGATQATNDAANALNNGGSARPIQVVVNQTNTVPDQATADAVGDSTNDGVLDALHAVLIDGAPGRPAMVGGAR